MRDEWRPKFKPQPPLESEKPAPPDEAHHDSESLPDDHPFSALAGHDPQLMKAMGMALRVLGDATDDERLRASLAQAAAGRTSFADLLQDGAFNTAFAQKAEATESAVNDVSNQMTDEDREANAAKGKAHAMRITENERLIGEVKEAFGPLADARHESHSRTRSP